MDQVFGASSSGSSPFSVTPNLSSDLSNLQSSVASALGFGTLPKTAPGRNLPWDKNNSKVDSAFFHYIDIDPTRWDQLYPYRLIVVDATQGNAVVGGSSDLSVKVTTGTGETTVNFQPLGKSWIFTLPITPEQLNITDQYAINTSATLLGIMEEHNGVKFKMINAQGTLGVWSQRESVTAPPSSPNILQSIFGGTIEAAQNVATQFTSVINTISTGNPNSKPVSKRPSGSSLLSTGYFQALALQQFLEQYAEAKKSPLNSGWRLVFDMPKQNQSFVVTPMPFTWIQNKNNPMQVNYSMQFKAWRRINLKVGTSETAPNNYSVTPGILQRVLNTITAAQNTASASLNLIGAVTSDLEAPLNVLRQTALFVKDLAGVVITAADLPFQLQSDYASSIAQSLNILSSSISSISTDPTVRNSIAQIQAATAQNEGLSIAAVSSGQLGTGSSAQNSINPANNVFANPEANYALFSQVPVYTLALDNAQQAAVDQAIDDARATTVDDLKSYRNQILNLAIQLSNNFGAGSSYYSQVYGTPPPASRVSPMNLDEYQILQDFYDVIQSYDILTATNYIDSQQNQTNMQYVAGLAADSDIPFQITQSKILAPVPYGLTIEAIALRYLGDAQRWLEIATLNNLRDPYIDESGFQVPLLSNATGRQISIGSTTNLYIGQRVVLMGANQSPSARTILAMETLSSTSYLLTLDGLANLDNFTIASGSYLQAYLPGTVNSQQKIFIPSDLPAPTDSGISIPASVANDPLVGLSKVDFLLTDQGDLAVNNFGDFRLAAGMTNLIQALRIKIATIQGSCIVHPTFGLGLRAGIMNTDISTQDIFNSINRLIQLDPRFTGVNSLQVNLKGPTLSISMAVGLPGQQGVFPVTFQLPTQ